MISTNIGVTHKFPPKFTLVIGNKNYSSWSMRPWLALAGRGIPFAEVLIPLDHPNTKQQVLQYSPTGQVPVMKYGQLLVWDSLAIVEYVNDMHPEAGLWPQELEYRAVARALCAEIHSGFQAFRQACPMNLRRRQAGRLTSQADQDVLRMVNYWRQLRLSAGGSGPFLFGEFGAVDAFFAPLASRIRSYEIPVDRVANEYIDAIYNFPAFQKWYQAAIAEPWKIASVDGTDRSGIQRR